MKKRWLASILAVLLMFGGCNFAPNNNLTDNSQGTSNSSDTGSTDSGDGSSNTGSTDSGSDGSSDTGSTDSGSDGSSDTGSTDSGSSGGESVDENCVDSNDDGVCDDCKESVLVTLDIFAVNDLHGKVLDDKSQEGVDELSTYIKNAKAKNEYTFTLSSGDMWQGTAEAGLTYGNLVTDWMNEMDFVSMTLGNHEFDWGEEYIEQNAALAQFPFLGINVFDTKTNKRVDYCDSSVMVELGGLKVGVIGAIGDCYSSISSDKVTEVYFKTGYELTALVKAEAQSLRAQGADCIVYSVHDGYGNYDSALSNGYVDVVFEGHTHQAYVYTDSYGVSHLQGGGDNDGITQAKLEVNFARNEAETKSAKTVPIYEYSHLTDDSSVEIVAQKYSEEVALARKKLGKNDVYRSSNELCDLAAKLYVQAGLEKWGDEYDIVLGGGYINTRSPYEMQAGTITYGDVYNLFPFNNPLVLCSVSGSTLKKQFLNNSRYHVYCSAYGESIKNNIVDGEKYYIVIDSYSSLYKYNNATEIDRYDDSTYARDLLAAFIENGGYTTQPDDSGNQGNTGNTGGTGSEQITLTSIATALQIGEGLQDNYITNDYFYVKGTVIDVPNATWGNLTLADSEGNEIWVYGLYDSKGNRYDSQDFNVVKPKQGDTIIVKAQIMKYYNANTGERKIELKDATFIQKTDEAKTYSLTDIEDIYTIGQGLEANGETSQAYYVVGEIIDIEDAEKGIFTIRDVRGNTLYIYRVTDENGLPFSTTPIQPAIGKKVLIKGIIKRYVSAYNGSEKIELFDAILIPYEE